MIGMDGYLKLKSKINGVLSLVPRNTQYLEMRIDMSKFGLPLAYELHTDLKRRGS